MTPNDEPERPAAGAGFPQNSSGRSWRWLELASQILMCARGLPVATSNVAAMICKRARMPNKDGPGARWVARMPAVRSWRAQNPDAIFFGRARLQVMNEGDTCDSVKHRSDFLPNQNSPFAGSNVRVERPRLGVCPATWAHDGPSRPRRLTARASRPARTLC